jgi:putative proteasome-type protease
MKSNVTVGPPIDLLLYATDELRISRYRRFDAHDSDLRDVRAQWEQGLRKAVLELPEIRFAHAPNHP